MAKSREAKNRDEHSGKVYVREWEGNVELEIVNAHASATKILNAEEVKFLVRQLAKYL